MKKPHILITNDDGVDSKGIRYLWEAISSFADVTIVAPSEERSGSGTSFNYLTPIRVDKEEWKDGTKVWRVHGSPTDCVKLGLSSFVDNQPDLVLSGINFGTNAGRTAIYSGTVGGVIEAVMRNIKGVAFSCCQEEGEINHVKKYIEPVVRHALDITFPHGTLLNVNFPCHEEEGFRGFRLARQGRGYWVDRPKQVEHPEGLLSYSLGGRWANYPEHEESDVSLLREGFITAVPIHVSELTDHSHLEEHRSTFEQLDKLFEF